MVNKSITKIRTEIRAILRVQLIPTIEATHFAETLLAKRSAEESVFLQSNYELFLDLMEIRHKPTGLAHALDGVRELILACLQINKVEIEDAEQIVNSFSFFAEDVKASAGKKEFFAHPLQKDNLMIYVLSARRQQLLEMPDGKTRWNRLIVVSYIAARLALDSAIATQPANKSADHIQSGDTPTSSYGQLDDHAKSSERATFKAVKYLELKRITEKTPVVLDKLLVSSAITIALTAEGEKFDSISYRYVEWAKTLLAGEILERARGSASVRNKKIDTIRCGTAKDDKSSNRQLSERERERQLERRKWKKEVVEEVADGGSFDEFDPPLTPSEEQNLRQGLSERARLYRPLGHTPPWHRSLLTQERLGVIVSRLQQQSVQNDIDLIPRQLLAFVVAQIHTGLSGDMLVGTRVRRNDDAENLPGEKFPVLYDNGFLHIRLQKYDNTAPFGAPDSPYTANCLSGSHSFALLAPPLVRSLFDSLLSNGSDRTGYLFNKPEQNGEFSRIGIKTLNAELQAICSDLTKRIDLNIIGRSAAIHLVSYGESDELIAAFISGFVPRHLGAQEHYVNISVAHLQRVFDKAAELIWKRLCSKSAAAITVLGSPTLDELESESQIDDLAPVKNVVLIENVKLLSSGDVRFGSPFVPDFGFARQYLKQLRDLINKTSNLFVRFNCLTLYNALCVMFLAGLRSIEIERLTVDHIAFSRNDSEATLTVLGKNNRFFEEWRVLRLPSPYGTLLARYKQSSFDFAKFLTREVGVFPSTFKEERNNSFFFFVEDERYITPITTDNFRLKMRTGIPGELEQWLLRMNAPRHFFATTALELGIPRRSIDALVGHSTQGREALGRYSLLPLENLRNAARAISDEVAQRLDIPANFYGDKFV